MMFLPIALSEFSFYKMVLFTMKNHSLSSIETPAALIDEARMLRNMDRMQTRLNQFGVVFRPHAKTAKCVEVAKRQLERGAVGITVSTLKEADEFFAAGFNDILYAVCIVPHKLGHAAQLIRAGCKLTIITDSIASAQAIVDYSAAHGVAFSVMIEVDTDGHRSGIAPDSPLLISVAKTLHQGQVVLLGVMTHAGSSYDFSTPDALQKIAEQERSLCVLAAEQLRAAGFTCPVVSVGSTPTALSATSLTGVTEVRAGVYVFFDLVMANIGVCKTDDIALSVLTSVIGHQPEKGWVIVDAGWMAMSRDRGTQKQAHDYGYGLVCDENGVPLANEYLLGSANQEHGIIFRQDGSAPADLLAQFPVGKRLRVLPNHACATAAQFPKYEVVNDGKPQTWPRFYGW